MLMGGIVSKQRGNSVLVTGAEGFIGSYLVKHLHSVTGEQIVSTVYPDLASAERLKQYGPVHVLDVRRAENVQSLFQNVKPRKVYHLAAQSFSMKSWDDPVFTFETNIIGTVNIFESLRDLETSVLVACSSAEYGFPLNSEYMKEDHSLSPVHPYGISKLAQDHLAAIYSKRGIRTIRARIFNTTGPGKQGDVCADFVQRAVRIKNNLDKLVFHVGNLEPRRSFLNVNDTVHALYLLMEYGRSGEAYNICGDTQYSIQEILKKVCAIIDIQPSIQSDPTLVRNVDEPLIFGDTTKIRRETGWKPTIPLEKTLMGMVEHEQDIYRLDI